MSFFKTKPKPLPKVDETYEERFTKLEKQVSALKAEVLDSSTTIDSLRNKVLRKIQTRQDEEPQNQKVFKPGSAYY